MERRFPADFLWGTSTSSHQVEGDNRRNDWWAWEALPGRIHDGTRSGRAAEWWAGRAEEDLARAAELGQNAHRMSLEWSRLEPEEGRFDDAAFGRYRAVLRAQRELGMKRLVALSHFTLPRWASERGSWLAEGTVEAFVRYARECVHRLGLDVDRWATFNEPAVLALMGYLRGEWPPGRTSVGAFRRALRNLLRAHVKAYHAMRETSAKARVGIVLNLPAFDPARPSSLADRGAARAQDEAFNELTLRALRQSGAFDWIGVNYYGRFRVRFDRRSPALLFGAHETEGNTRTSHTDWGEPCPDGLARQLLRASRLGAPVYVTENGIYDNDDHVRPSFIESHVAAVHDAIRRGADVRGYFHWTLVDNFEWAEGWATHFGLFALDRETQLRTARSSAEVYARICRANGL